MSVLRFENIGMRYDRGAEVLSDVTVTIPTGSFTFLSGPSGSGKTSLIRLMTVDALPGRGRLSILGVDVLHATRPQRADLRRQIGVVWQDFRLLPDLTAFENVALPLRLMGVAEHKIRNAVDETLRWVGILDARDRLPMMLSGGQQQRIAVARAVIARPKLLIADEPTGNLDSAAGARILSLFEQLHALGTTVVVATHAPQLLSSVPTAKHIVLENGRVAA